MEPISIATTAIELIATLTKVGRLAGKIMADIKGCGPKGEGLLQLAGSLSTVSNICARTKSILDRTDPESASETVSDIKTAVVDLEALLVSIDEEIRSTGQLSAVKRTVLVVQRKLSRKKLAELASQLDKRVVHLQQLITWDIWSLSCARTTQWRTGEESTTPREIVAAVTQASSDHRLLAKSELTVTRRTLASLPYVGQVNHASTKSQSYRSSQDGLGDENKIVDVDDDDDDEEDAVVEATGAISLSVAFLSRCLTLQYRTSLYAPISFSLRFGYLLDGHSSRSLALRIGTLTLKGFQNLLSSGEISLYTSGPHGSLFYIVASTTSRNKTDICRFLLEQDSTGEIFAGLPESHFRWISPVGSRGYDELLDMVLAKSRTQLCLKTYRFLIFQSAGPDDILACYARYCEFAPSFSGDFAAIAEARAISLFALSRMQPRAVEPEAITGPWNRLFGELVRSGGRAMAGSLAALLRRSNDPFTAPEHVQELLDIVDSCGLDLPAYLRREIPGCKVAPGRVLVSYTYRGGLIGVSWEWRIGEPGSNAAEVLTEYKNFNDAVQTEYMFLKPDGGRVGVGLAWAVPWEYWPFVFYRVEAPDEGWVSKEDLGAAYKRYRAQQDRLARRYAKRSGMRWKRTRMRSMPGEFPDE